VRKTQELFAWVGCGLWESGGGAEGAGGHEGVGGLDLGGQVAVRGDADRGALGTAGRTAACRALQELLTNARRHAPGSPTTLDLDWADEMLTITASTPGGGAGNGATPGAGRGLAGMRERVTGAGGVMSVCEGPPFVVVLRLPGERPA